MEVFRIVPGVEEVVEGVERFWVVRPISWRRVLVPPQSPERMYCVCGGLEIRRWRREVREWS